jgi:hypothetical protein
VASAYVIVAVPALTPVTTPDAVPTIATPVLLLLHVPPVEASARVVVLPTHVVSVPVTGSIAFTVTTTLVLQPPAIEYVIPAVPPDTPATRPEAEPTVATPVLLLLHVPPLIPSARAKPLPAHIGALPVMAGKPDSTVTVVVTKQPEAAVNVMTDVPADSPDTTPELFMVATAVLPLVHVPPATLFNTTIPPTHNVVGPTMAAGAALMVITRET